MYQLSASKLNVLNSCPRCFWNENVRKVARPRGIFPSLPGGMDRILKDYFDNYRGSIPPILEGKIPGVLMPEILTLNKWRNWRTGLRHIDTDVGVKLIGALDDCLYVESGNLYIPLDCKTKGSKPKTDGAEYYQTQLDCYALLLSSNGYEISDKAFLFYVWPEKGDGALTPDGESIIKLMNMTFGAELFTLQADAGRAKELLAKAVEILEGPCPEPTPGCEYCDFALKYNV